MRKEEAETEAQPVLNGKIELFDVSYDALQITHSDELYRLRKITFSDRLKWDVVCNVDMESDEFDNPDTRYILGLYNGQLICSVRFTGLAKPNMITHTFRAQFDSVPLPPDGVESSRFFVDKDRARELLGERCPVTRILFLAMINWARRHGYRGIHTIVSRPMLTILRRSGWQITTLKEAHLSERERIYLVYLPARAEDREQMTSGLISQYDYPAESAFSCLLSQ